MQRVEIKGTGRPSAILVGEKIENLHRYLPAGRTVVITDVNVRQLYGDRFPEAPVLSIGSGEAVKTLETAKDLYETLLSLEADRATFILGIGGGIVCDVTGFVASTFMRGLRFGFVATTLLAQVFDLCTNRFSLIIGLPVVNNSSLPARATARARERPIRRAPPVIKTS